MTPSYRRRTEIPHPFSNVRVTQVPQPSRTEKPTPFFPRTLQEWMAALGQALGVLWKLAATFGSLLLICFAWKNNYLPELSISSLTVTLVVFGAMGLILTFFLFLVMAYSGFIWLLARNSHTQQEVYWARPLIYFSISQSALFLLLFLPIQFECLNTWKFFTTMVLLPPVSYFPMEYFLWGKKRETPHRFSDGFLIEFLSVTLSALSILVYARLLPHKATWEQAFEIFVGFSLFVIAANSVIACQMELRNKLRVTRDKYSVLAIPTIWITIAIIFVVLTCQTVTDTVMRNLNIGSIENYPLVVNDEGMSLAIAAGFITEPIKSPQVATPDSGNQTVTHLYQIKGADLVTLIGPSYVLKKHFHTDEKTSSSNTANEHNTTTSAPFSDETSERYLAIPKAMGYAPLQNSLQVNNSPKH